MPYRTWLKGAVIGAVVGLSVAPAGAFAQDMTASGADFARLCRATTQVARDTCGAVIVSIIDAQVKMTERRPDLRVFCPSRRLTNEQAARVFMIWANRNANFVDMPFPEVVVTALRARYPCGPRKQD